MASARPSPEAEPVGAHVERGLTLYVDNPQKRDDDLAEATAALPAAVLAWLESLTAKSDSYRDALLVLLGVPVVRGNRTQLREREEGWRTATRRVGGLLK